MTRIFSTMGVALMAVALGLHWVSQDTTRWYVSSDYWKMVGAPWLLAGMLLTLGLTWWRPWLGFWGALVCLGLGTFNGVRLYERLDHYQRVSQGQLEFAPGPGLYCYLLGATLVVATTMVARARLKE